VIAESVKQYIILYNMSVIPCNML